MVLQNMSHSVSLLVFSHPVSLVLEWGSPWAGGPLYQLYRSQERHRRWSLRRILDGEDVTIRCSKHIAQLCVLENNRTDIFSHYWPTEEPPAAGGWNPPAECTVCPADRARACRCAEVLSFGSSWAEIPSYALCIGNDGNWYFGCSYHCYDALLSCPERLAQQIILDKGSEELFCTYWPIETACSLSKGTVYGAFDASALFHQ
jgi:hypothetical protein